jgi:folate-binding protein YgfZ
MNSDAIVPLDHFGFFSITGRDAEKFLQGYTTCDLGALGDAEVMRGAICNIKGRMVSNFLVTRIEAGLLLRLHRDLVEPTLSFLGKYIVFSKAQMQNKSDELTCYGIVGDSLTAGTEDLTQEPSGVTHTEAGTYLNIGQGNYEIWSSSKLEAAGSLNQWLAREIAAGVVWVDADTSEEYIPQMFNLHNIQGISFDKGCYLGQEIVARMQYRGELKKRLHLVQVSVDDEASVKIGARILSAEEKNLGHVVGQAGNHLALVIKAGEAHYQLEDGTQISPTEVAEETIGASAG